MTEKHVGNLPEIGYQYHYPRGDQVDGIFQLDIFISNIPTEKHFDVSKVDLKGLNRQNKFVKFCFVHPWYAEKRGRACAGSITMVDRNGVKEEAFSFGGNFEVEVKQSQTKLSLSSSAPIMDITSTSLQRSLFVDEVCAMLAQQRARFHDSEEFFKILCDIEPIVLYLACVDQVIIKLEQIPGHVETYQELSLHLQSQLHRLGAAGNLVDAGPSLDELFSQ